MAITAVGENQTFSYTGGIQTFTVPYNGIYKLEVLGAAGASTSTYLGTNAGGLGGLSWGYKRLTAGTTIYICLGGKGKNTGTANSDQATATPASGGYNGGGTGGWGRYLTDKWHFVYGGSGGGCSHMALVTGTLESIGVNNLSQVLLVAGGGGGACYFSSNDYTVGAGGGLTGGNGYSGVTGGTQSSGAYFGKGATGASYFQNTSGDAISQANGGGGGGLYGGKACQSLSIPGSGAGGSGYIGGVDDFDSNNTKGSTAGYSTGTGNGWARITWFAKGELPVVYNGTTLEKIIYNGTEITSLIYNGKTIF